MNNKSEHKVTNELLKSAKRCNQDFKCKTENWETCSKIDEKISDMILHFDKTNDEKRMNICNYHLPFGGEHYCTCPARLYIYKKYDV